MFGGKEAELKSAHKRADTNRLSTEVNSQMDQQTDAETEIQTELQTQTDRETDSDGKKEGRKSVFYKGTPIDSACWLGTLAQSVEH